nr:response regulator [Gemmatimonadaceae bacterium]
AELRARVRNLLQLKSYGDYYGKYSEALEAQVMERTAELASSEVFLRSTIDALPLEIVIVGPEGELVAVNEAWKSFARENNYTGDFISGVNYLSVCDSHASISEDAFLTGRAIRSIIAGELKDFRLEYPCDSDTEKRWFCMDVRAFGSAIPTSVVITHQDVTTRKHMETQLLHKQKLESMGQLAGGVAHDFNNILTVIRSYGDLLLADTEIAPAHRKDIEEISRAADRATNLTRQLLAFSRKETVSPRIFDLNEQLSNIQSMLGRLIGEDVKLVVDYQPGVHLISIDPTHLEQAVMNLAINARDAMPRGGVLTITTRLCTLGADCPELSADMDPGKYVLLSVTDTGSGMDAETLARVFEPFFTTKPEGEGTGLGLSTVFGIVSQANAHVRVASTPGKGTEFLIHFPIAEGQISFAAIEKTNNAQRGGEGERILFVEDEASLRKLGSRILEKNGFSVSLAADCIEALKICSESAVPFDLACIDVVMPGMGGGELAVLLLDKYPALKILMMSGFNDDDLLRRGIGNNSIPFIQKPYTPTDLVAKIREALLDNASQSSPYLRLA